MIEEELLKYNLEEGKYYRLDTLYTIMQELGIINMKRGSFVSDWIRRKRENGTLILPQKARHDIWKLSGRVIKDIVKAFIPGGKGEYNHEVKI